MGHIPNYLPEKSQTALFSKNLYPNCKPIDREKYKKLQADVAQEQAYWIQSGTATLQMAECSQPECLEVNATDPFQLQEAEYHVYEDE